MKRLYVHICVENLQDSIPVWGGAQAESGEGVCCGPAPKTRTQAPPAARPACPCGDRPVISAVAPLGAHSGARPWPTADKVKILFLCTGNACRSQMCEGWTRHLKGDLIEASSAGVAPHGVDPRAVKIMAEAGVDISSHTSKHLDALKGVAFDYVITVCDAAAESCPIFPGQVKKVHRGFQDPPRLAREAKSEAEALAHYRRVRDEIRAFIETLPKALER